jgi:hypothetical protein
MEDVTNGGTLADPAQSARWTIQAKQKARRETGLRNIIDTWSFD